MAPWTPSPTLRREQPRALDPRGPVGDMLTDEEKRAQEAAGWIEQSQPQLDQLPSTATATIEPLSLDEHAGDSDSIQARGSGGPSSSLIKPPKVDPATSSAPPLTTPPPSHRGVPPASYPASYPTTGMLGGAANFPGSVVPPGGPPAAGGESIEALRKRMGLVEYKHGLPPAEMGSAFGQSYRKVGGGHGSYSQMASTNYKQPLAELYDTQHRAQVEAGTAEARAHTEDVSQFPETTDPKTGQKIPPHLVARGSEVRTRQRGEDRRTKLAQEIAQIDRGRDAALADLEHRPDYQTAPPQKQEALKADIHDEAEKKFQRALMLAMLDDESERVPGAAFR